MRAKGQVWSGWKREPLGGGLTRILASVGLALAAVLFLAACRESEPGKFLKIGLPEEPRSLNLWLGTDRNSSKILSLIYQPLFRRHPESLEIIPWLAKEDPVFDPERLTYTVRLRKTKWSDGSAFTSQDVLFTRKLFFDFKIPRYYSKWKIIQKCEAPDAHTVVFHLKKPSAIFMSRVLTAPIVSKKEWEKRAAKALTREKPLRSLQAEDIRHPLGTGPFVLSAYQKGAYIHMEQNPHFFGLGKDVSRIRLGPHVDHLLFRIYGTSDVAILALKKGDIDYYWWDIQPGYIQDLEEQKNVTLFFNRKSALYYLGFNLRKPPFNDKILRQALATVIDKEFILTRILQNHGMPMHSIVPSGNHFWHNPHVRRYGHGLTRAERIGRAVTMLKEAGYSWEVEPVDKDGHPVAPSPIILPGGKQMARFLILTPPADYDPKRAFAGTMVQEWFRELGLPAFARPMAFNSLLDTVKGKRKFDAFVLGYGRLNLDPDYLRVFFYSKNDKPRGWNMSGYNNPEFDRIANEQRSMTTRELRRKKILRMQEIILEDLPYFPLYNPDIIEAVNNGRFSGWVQQVDGIGNIWSLCRVRPKG